MCNDSYKGQGMISIARSLEYNGRESERKQLENIKTHYEVLIV